MGRLLAGASALLTMSRRGEERLRRHRVSLPGALYFVTMCVKDRRSTLTEPPVATTIDAELRACETAGHVTLHAFTLMPDHVHIVFQLSANLPVERVIARIKAKTRTALSQTGSLWQANFFEHRIRPDEHIGPIIRYLFANPYRKGLLPASERWPWFWCSAAIAEWFDPTTDDGKPFPEWLDFAEE